MNTLGKYDRPGRGRKWKSRGLMPYRRTHDDAGLRRLAVTVALAAASLAAMLIGLEQPAFAGSLASPGWSVSNSAPGATGVSYTYTFTTATASSLDSVTMTLPAGTAGTPAVAAVSPALIAAGGTVSLTGSTLTYAFTPVTITSGTPVSIQLTGLTNTTTSGSYAAVVTTSAGGAPVDSGTTPAVIIAGTLASPGWSVSGAASAATGVSYTYTFTTATGSSLDSITMTVPPGTAGTPAVGVVTPAPVATVGAVSLSGDTLTYTFTPAFITAGTAVSIQLTGLTNTTTAGSYTAVITTVDGASLVDSGTTPAANITGALTGPDWSVSNAAPGFTGVRYAYKFTTATASSLDSVTMTVPPGTAGTPAVGAVTPAPVAAGGAVSLADGTLTYSFTPAAVSAGTALSIQLTGLTNTTTVGRYTAAIGTFDGTSLIDAGTTPAISFPASLTLTSPGSLAWAVTDSGMDQSAVDTAAADQQFTVDDATGAEAGWHITVSATTFTDGTHTLPDTDRLELTGSLSSPTSAAPTAACVGSCTLPADTTTYPVAITTAASSPDAFTIYNATANTGVGVITIGGHNATHPIGWWIQVPGSALAGSYTSTLTFTLVSGP
jgi:hypothetical protein